MAPGAALEAASAESTLGTAACEAGEIGGVNRAYRSLDRCVLAGIAGFRESMGSRS